MRDEYIEIARCADRYRRCIQEIKFRMNEADAVVKRISSHRPNRNTVFGVEILAIHIRKSIELVALASIAANEDAYKKIRENFHKDWNARYIFSDIEKLNEKFYPVPISGMDGPEDGSGPISVHEHESGFLTKEESILLYDKCNGVLHADSPYRVQKNYVGLLADFENSLSEMRVLLENFWVNLVPIDRLFCVSSHFGSNKSVEIALFEVKL